MKLDESVTKRQLKYMAETKAWIVNKFSDVDKRKTECRGLKNKIEESSDVNLVAARIVPYYGNIDSKYFVIAGCERRVNGNLCEGFGECEYAIDNKELIKKSFPNFDTRRDGPLNSEFFYYLETKNDVEEPFWEGLV